jgi:hypothetical protein
MRLAMRFFLRAIICVFLTSCAVKEAIDHHKEQESRMAKSVNAYIGRSVADVAVDRGPPTNVVDVGSSKRDFQWEIMTERPERPMPAPGSGIAATVPPGQETCLVSFVASSANPSPSLSDWIIESGQWKGVNC